jgi:hypothetical protein
MRWGKIDDTTWPVDDDGEMQWSLRYGNDDLLRGVRMSAASVVESYRYLTDPNLSQADAIRALKRARRAVGDIGKEQRDE